LCAWECQVEVHVRSNDQRILLKQQKIVIKQPWDFARLVTVHDVHWVDLFESEHITCWQLLLVTWKQIIISKCIIMLFEQWCTAINANSSSINQSRLQWFPLDPAKKKQLGQTRGFRDSGVHAAVMKEASDFFFNSHRCERPEER
jgi:hypothetical protein